MEIAGAFEDNEHILPIICYCLMSVAPATVLEINHRFK